ncbi:MAG: methyltransferase domain-containing protein [Candidatus Brocadiae bacterium]|nr:methyltransferase domain-containing protein [Candidatus Brocadiia bacterium]
MHPTPQKLLETLQAFHASAVLNAALQLDLFTPLARGPKTAAQVARALKCPERSTGILLDAVAALGFLAKADRRYRLDPEAAAFLLPSSPQFAGATSRIVCDPVLWDAMGRFAQAVRHGGTVLPIHAESHNTKFWETFADHSHALASPPADYAAHLLQRFLEERFPARVLDVACGSGVYGLTVAARCPGAKVTLLDHAPVLGAARKRAQQLGLTRRAEFVGGDMFAADLKGPFDVVILSQVLHHFAPPVCEQLLRKVAKSVAPGGRLLVHEFVSDEDRATNVPAAMFAALMLAWTREGNTYTFSEYKRMFGRAGFLPPVLHAPPRMATQFLVAEIRKGRGRR